MTAYSSPILDWATVFHDSFHSNALKYDLVKLISLLVVKWHQVDRFLLPEIFLQSFLACCSSPPDFVSLCPL